MSAPLWLFLCGGSLTLATVGLRRKPVAASIAAAGGWGAITLLILLAPIDIPFSLLGIDLKLEGAWTILGRSFILGEANRDALAFLFGAGALMFGGAWVAQPGRYFQSVGSLMLLVLAASLLIEPFLYAAIFLELAAMGGVILLASSAPGAGRSTSQLLVLFTVAMLSILFTGWLLENAGVTSVTEQLAIRVLALLGLGFAVLMFVPPFHFWIPMVSGTTNPYSLALVALVLQSAGMFFLLHILDAYTWIRLMPGIFEVVRICGAIMVVFGAMTALAQQSLASAGAYTLISDIGAGLVAIGSNSPLGYQLALGMSGSRVVSMAIWSLGQAVLQRRAAGEAGSLALRGIGHRLPVASTASLIGLLGLVGFPLTSGFPGRWALLCNLPNIEPSITAAILLAIVLGSLTAARWARLLLAESDPTPMQAESRGELALLSGGVLMCLGLGLFPQLLFPWITKAVGSLGILFP